MRDDEPNSKHGSKREDGFTLVEMLVAVFLLALMSVLILGGMRGGISAVERARDLTAQSEVWAVQKYLRDIINGAQKLSIPSVNGRSLMMDGHVDRMVFVTSHTVSGQYGGFYVTTLSAARSETNPNLKDLWISQELFHRHGEIFAQSRKVFPRAAVLRNIADLEIRYFGEKGDDDGIRMHPGWGMSEQLPNLVEIDVRFAHGDHRRWPLFASAIAVSN